MLIYSLVWFLRPAIYIFLLPLYLEVFTEAEYGLYDLMSITSGFFMIIVTLRLSSSMLTIYYDYFKDETLKKKYLSSLFTTSLLIALVFIGLAYLFGETVFSVVFNSSEVKFFPYGFTIMLYAVLSEVNACYYIFLKNEKSLGKFVFISLLQILLVIIFQFYYIVIARAGVQGAVFAMLLSNVITTLTILFMEKGILTTRIDFKMIKKSLKFSVNLIPYLVIFWIISKGGKLFLERYHDLETVGLFALLITIVGIISLVVDAVVNGVRPFLFELFTEPASETNKQKMRLLIKMIIFIPLLAIPTIVFVANNIGFVNSKPHYQQIGMYSTLACLATYAFVFSKLFYQQLVFVKRSDIITINSMVVAFVLCICFYLWVAKYSINGVLYSTLIANVLMSILFYIMAQRKYPLDYSIGSLIGLPLLVFAALFGIEYFMVTAMDYSRGIFGLTQFLILMSILLLMFYSSIKQYKKLFVN